MDENNKKTHLFLSVYVCVQSKCSSQKDEAQKKNKTTEMKQLSKKKQVKYRHDI